MYFQEIIAKLNEYWSSKGCVIIQGYDLEVGAGTFNPSTFLRVLGPNHGKRHMSSRQDVLPTAGTEKIRTGFSIIINIR